MTRMLVQFIDDNPFGGKLHDFGLFNNFNKAVEESLTFFHDKTVRSILINDGNQWVRIK
jgi:hypothetical protein